MLEPELATKARWPVGVDGDEVGEFVDGDGGDDAVGGGVDDGDGAVAGGGAGVDDVDLVADGIDGEAGGVDADLEGAVLAEVDEVEDGDGVGGAVGDVGELAVAGRSIGEVVVAAACEEDEGAAERERQKADRAGHCCESKCSEACGLD